jgi:energy-coupling factor transporter ATP-binding protein EcfA2
MIRSGFFLSAFGRLHEGDEIVAECLIMSLASRLVTNSQGLHVLVTGESGKGKSHAFETMMSLVPEKFCLAGHVSNKALFYQDELRDGMVISIDDHALSPTLQEIVKGVTSSFHKPFVYRTVDKDRRPVMRVIPPRCVWWVAKVEGAGDEQVLNRMLTVWIDESDEQDERVLARALRRAAEPAGSMGSSQEEVLIARRSGRGFRRCR